MCHDLGPADPLRRAVRRRAKLVRQRISSLNRLTALLELLGPGYNDALSGGLATKTAQAVLSRYADPRKLLRTPATRLVQVVSAASRGQHGPILVNQLRGAAAEALALYGMAEVDFAELAADIEAEMRSTTTVQAEIDQLDTRIQHLYHHADPDQIVQTEPGVGPVLAPAIHGLFGHPHRFVNLAAARAFTGLVPTPTSPASARHRPDPPKQVIPGCGPPCSWPPTWPGRPTHTGCEVPSARRGTQVAPQLCGLPPRGGAGQPHPGLSPRRYPLPDLRTRPSAHHRSPRPSPQPSTPRTKPHERPRPPRRQRKAGQATSEVAQRLTA